MPLEARDHRDMAPRAGITASCDDLKGSRPARNHALDNSMNTDPLTRSNAPPSAWPPVTRSGFAFLLAAGQLGTEREQLHRAQTPKATPPAEQLELAALQRRVARFEYDICGIDAEGRR
jgi:hypothetical protein